MIIDSHCHLDYEPLSKDIDQVINRAKKEGVKFFLTIGTEDNGFSKILDITNKYKEVFCSYGIHPHEAKNHKSINREKIIKKVNLNKKIIGIGETGLDFFYNHSDEKDQIKLFIEHIKAAQETNLPLIVHTRSAENKTIEILQSELKNKSFKILIHCFTGSKDFSKKLINIGAYISASGIITFKKSEDLAKTFKAIPNDRILIETDSPYLAPVPYRGKSNEPSYIVKTAKFLSDLKNIKFEEFTNITTNNFFKLFGDLS